MNNQEVADVINNEGIGYAVTSYMDETGIEDPYLKEQWRIARECLVNIQKHLGNLLD